MMSNLLPSDWKVVPLGQLLKSAQSGFASGARDPNGAIQMRMNNVTTDGNLDWTSFIRVPASQKQLDKYCLRPGDVLFNSTNSPELVGKTAAFDGHTELVVFSNHFVRLRVDETRLDPWYLARWLTDQWQRRVFESLCTRWVNQASVRKDDLLSLRVPLPPLPEQKRIAVVLAKADRLRRLRRTARALSDTYLQSVFLGMFGDPVSNPMGWETLDFGKVISIISGHGFKKAEYSNNGVRLLQIANVSFQEVLWDTLAYLPPDYIERYPRLVLKPGDLLMALNHPILGHRVKFAVLKEEDCPAILYQRVGKFVIESEKLDRDYLYGFMLTDYYFRELEVRLAGSDQPYINPTELVKMRFLLPPLPLQQQFAHIVHQFERFCAQQREAERQAQHPCQTLLHRAFRRG